MERSLEDLSRYRYACCVEALEDARIMYGAERYKNALNRAYYAIFHAMRAVTALDGFDSSKHSGVISYFNQQKREKADYLDFYVASKREAAEQIENAETFRAWIENYLKEKHIL